MAAAQPVLSFVIVGPGDAPAYEADLALPSFSPASSSSAASAAAATAPGGRDERAAYLHSFIQNAALDAVDDAAWGGGGGGGGAGGGGGGGGASLGAPYHGVVDRFNNLMVSAYTTPAGARMLLLHDGRPDDAVRGFLRDVHECVVKASLNPFCSLVAVSSGVGGKGGRGSGRGGAQQQATAVGRIASPAFDRKVRGLARSYFRV